MTTSTSTNPPSQEGFWQSLKAYAVPPVAASLAVVPVYFDLVAKNAMQMGKTPVSMSLREAVKGGVCLAPSTGVLVGSQMVLQPLVEQALTDMFPHFFTADSMAAKASLTLGASAAVGVLSSPFVAVFNGQSMNPPLGVKKTLSSLSFKKASAITLQETGFVVGIAAADVVSAPMKQMLGDHKSVEYLAAAVSGALGSLAGNPGNTALTRWQNGLGVDNVRQLGLGSFRRARALSTFSVGYKCLKESFNSSLESK